MQKRTFFTKSLYLLVTAAMVLSLLPVSSQPLYAEDGPTAYTAADLNAATDAAPADVSVQRASRANVRALKASDSDGGTSTYIIQLVEQPVALYEGGIDGLRPTSPQVTGADGLDMTDSDVQAYASHLQVSREQFILKMGEILGRGVDVSYEYFATLNGMAVTLTAEEAVTVAPNGLMPTQSGMASVRFRVRRAKESSLGLLTVVSILRIHHSLRLAAMGMLTRIHMAQGTMLASVIQRTHRTMQRFHVMTS